MLDRIARNALRRARREAEGIARGDSGLSVDVRKAAANVAREVDELLRVCGH